LESGRIKFAGIAAWSSWLAIHIYHLAGFKSRVLVVLQWAWSHFTYRRGARLIIEKNWRFCGRGE
jgi:NADH dehydrogenase